MANITMKIDDQFLQNARKIAIDKNTSLTRLIRAYPENLTAGEQDRKEAIVRQLRKSFSENEIRAGRKDWKREDLYEQ